MNKQEKIAAALLFALLIGWMFLNRTVTPPPAQMAQGEPRHGGGTNAANLQSAEITPPVSSNQPPVQPAIIKAEQEPVAAHAADASHIALTNSDISLKITSWGGAIVEAELKKFRASQTNETNSVVLDFSSRPALSFMGISGLSTASDFTVTLVNSGLTAQITGATTSGVSFRREITLAGDCSLFVRDIFTNTTSGAIVIPAHILNAGPMGMLPGESVMSGLACLSISTMETGRGVKPAHWMSSGTMTNGHTLDVLFQETRRQGGGCDWFKPAMTIPLPLRVEESINVPMRWVAVKNKFFTQIMTLQGTNSGCVLRARRVMPPNERAGDKATWAKSAMLDEVGAAVAYPGVRLEPGSGISRELAYYVGPKKYSILTAMGNSQDDIMEFGAWIGPLSKLLLRTLNLLYAVIPNYGVTIILLTILVRLVFWPITRKSTQSMKKMQEIQPLMAKIREKFKDNPQKMNQEMMALYKEHKVNPMAGCLPLLVQIPVFFALFNVLRSAVELRFAPFLWIKDLSEQEGLLAGVLPIPLNILPLVMTALTVWQTKLTPQTGDPQQQKMMMFMPLIFLFLFYTMPSALVLYWMTSTFLGVLGMLWQKKKHLFLKSPQEPAKA